MSCLVKVFLFPPSMMDVLWMSQLDGVEMVASVRLPNFDGSDLAQPCQQEGGTYLNRGSMLNELSNFPGRKERQATVSRDATSVCSLQRRGDGKMGRWATEAGNECEGEKGTAVQRRIAFCDEGWRTRDLDCPARWVDVCVCKLGWPQRMQEGKVLSLLCSFKGNAHQKLCTAGATAVSCSRQQLKVLEGTAALLACPPA